jgi:two-component system KDP operon response regulator KdpE
MGRLQGFKVLIIEDEPQQLKLTCRAFSWAKAQTFTAGSGVEGLQKLYAHRPDLITLDSSMPDMDGYELCRRIRVLSNTPIVILGTRTEDTEIIRSLRSGADDYIIKPFNPFVLISRAEAIVRRSAQTTTEKQELYADNYLTIEQGRPQVLLYGVPLDLTTKEYRLLIHLVRHANRAVTFRNILENVWGWEYIDNTEFVHVYISRLRRKLEKNPQKPEYLLTERGVGYRFESQTVR